MEVELADPGDTVVVVAPELDDDDVAKDYGPPRDSLLKLEGHCAAVNALSWHPQFPLLASASFDKTVLLWNTGDAECPAVSALRGHSSSVTDVHFIGNGTTIATCSADKTAAIYDSVTCERLKILRGHTSHVNCVCGREIGEAGRYGDYQTTAAYDYLVLSGSNDRSARIWDGRNRRRGAEIVLSHDYQVLTAVFGEESWTIFSSGIDPRIYKWDSRKPSSPVEYMTGHTDIVSGLCMSTLCSHVASHSADGRVGIWDVRPFVGDAGSGSRLERFLEGCSHGFEQNIMRPGWDLAGTRVAAGSTDGLVRVWDADDGELICSLGGHQGTVNDVCFSPQVDTLIASASNDKTVLLGHIPLSLF